MEGIRYVPFGEPHRALRGIGLPDFLEKSWEASAELHGMGGTVFVGGGIDRRSDVIRRCGGVADEAGLPVGLVNRRKAGDADAGAKDFQRHILG